MRPPSFPQTKSLWDTIPTVYVRTYMRPYIHTYMHIYILYYDWLFVFRKLMHWDDGKKEKASAPGISSFEFPVCMYVCMYVCIYVCILLVQF